MESDKMNHTETEAKKILCMESDKLNHAENQIKKILCMESDELSHTVSQIFFGYPYMQCLKTSISYLICIYRAFFNIMFKQFCKLSHFNS